MIGRVRVGSGQSPHACTFQAVREERRDGGLRMGRLGWKTMQTHHFCEAARCDYPPRMDEPIEKSCLKVQVAAEVVLDIFVYSSGNEREVEERDKYSGIPKLSVIMSNACA